MRVAVIGRKPSEGGFRPAARVTCYDSSRSVAVAVVVGQDVPEGVMSFMKPTDLIAIPRQPGFQVFRVQKSRVRENLGGWKFLSVLSLILTIARKETRIDC